MKIVAPTPAGDGFPLHNSASFDGVYAPEGVAPPRAPDVYDLRPDTRTAVWLPTGGEPGVCFFESNGREVVEDMKYGLNDVFHFAKQLQQYPLMRPIAQALGIQAELIDYRPRGSIYEPGYVRLVGTFVDDDGLNRNIDAINARLSPEERLSHVEPFHGGHFPGTDFFEARDTRDTLLLADGRGGSTTEQVEKDVGEAVHDRYTHFLFSEILDDRLKRWMRAKDQGFAAGDRMHFTDGFVSPVGIGKSLKPDFSLRDVEYTLRDAHEEDPYRTDNDEELKEIYMHLRARVARLAAACEEIMREREDSSYVSARG